MLMMAPVRLDHVSKHIVRVRIATACLWNKLVCDSVPVKKIIFPSFNTVVLKSFVFLYCLVPGFYYWGTYIIELAVDLNN